MLGCTIEINETGTILRYKPGLLLGGRISHDCSCSRSIGWFLEGILPMAPFCKSNLMLHLTGVTNDALDFSVDTLTTVTIPFLRNFGIEGCSLKVKRRGAAPKGGGIVEFVCPIVRELKTIFVTDCGLIKRVRGIGFCARISPTIIARVVESARGVLNNILPDVYINTDHYKGQDGGLSPGYSLSLVAESTTGVLLSVERTAMAGTGAGGEIPEQIGSEAALLLLEEIRRGVFKLVHFLVIMLVLILFHVLPGGVVDSSHQSLVLQLMVMGPEDVCKVNIYIIVCLNTCYGYLFLIFRFVLVN